MTDHTQAANSEVQESLATAGPETPEDFIDAELVPDAPSPLAFGMKAMFALMAISGVQFALMSWLGPLVGLLAGIGLCAVAMVVLLISTVVLRVQPGQKLMEHLDRIAIRLVVGMVTLFFGTILAGGGQIILMALEDARFAWRMQDELGIAYNEKTLFNANSNRINVLELTSVTSGGPFDRAGLQAGDLIRIEDTADEFLEKLDELRGQSIDLPVVNYATSTGKSQIDEETARSVTVQLPE